MIAGSFVDPRGDNGVSWGIRTPDPLSLILMVIGAAALVKRRRAPMLVLAVTATASLIESVTSDPRAPVAMCAVVALFTVAVTTDRSTTWRVALLTMTVLTGAAMLGGPSRGTPRRTSASSPGPAWPPPRGTPYAAVRNSCTP